MGYLMLADFNATPGTDIHAGLTAYMATVAATTGGTDSAQIILPRGLFTLTAELQVPNKISLKGASKRGTVLQAASSWAARNATVTITIASPAVVSWTAHGLVYGDTVTFATTGALPTGLVAGTKYYVAAAGLAADSFRLSSTIQSVTAVNTSGSQSGVHTATMKQPVVRLGVGSDLAFDTFLEDLWVDANHKANSIGVLTIGGQEGCGLRHALVSNFTDIGMSVAGQTTANTFFEDIEISNTADNSNYCMSLQNGNSVVITKATFVGKGIGSTLGGLYVNATTIVINNIHLEGMTDGIVIDGATATAGLIAGVDGPTGASDITNLIRMTNAGSAAVAIFGVQKNSATNIFVNNTNGVTLTNSYAADLSAQTLALAGSSTNDFDIAVTGSPFNYQNLNARRLWIVFDLNGGGISKVEQHRMGGSYYNVSGAATLGGGVLVAPGDDVRITYTGTPLIRAFPM